MGRQRRRIDQWMPPRVYRGKSAYELRAGSTVRLCPLTASKADVWAAYEQKMAQPSYLFGSLLKEYLESPRFQDLAPSTQKAYKRYARKDGPICKTFGHMDPNKIAPSHIRKFMDVIGAKTPVQANRYLAFLGAVFSWGYERGKVQGRPTRGVRRFTEKPREKYIEDDEYEVAYKRAKLFVQIAIEISYCCAARISDVLKVKHSDLSEQGLYIKQGKTGKAQIKKWTPRLKKAVRAAKSLPRYKKYSSTTSIYLIHNMRCEKYTYDGFSKEWQKAKQGLNFTFHDIKAKGVSDYSGDKGKFSGNKKTVGVYDRKTEVVDSLDFPPDLSEKNSLKP